jgi:hypothetical protein
MSLFDYYTQALEIMSTDPAASAGLAALPEAQFMFGNTFSTDTSTGGVDSEGNIGIPNYSFVRGAVPGTYNPDRRPGGRGQRYFTDYAYTPRGSEAGAQQAFAAQAAQLQVANAGNAMGYPGTYIPPSPTGMTMGNDGSGPASGVINLNPIPTNNGGTVGGGNTGFTGGVASQQFKYGGIAALAGGGAASAYNRRYHPYSAGGSTGRGYYLGGPTDGMADEIPATIDGTQEARLSDGEFVVPADVVSHLGNGNSNAGAKNLYSMMDKVRQARTGNTQQGKEINPNKFIPSR